MISILFAGNALSTFPDLWHVRLTVIKVYLQYNLLTSVPPSALTPLTLLTTLNLCYNSLHSLPSLTRLPPSLALLELTNNPLSCGDPGLRWLVAMRGVGVGPVVNLPPLGCNQMGNGVERVFTAGGVVGLDMFDNDRYSGM